MPLFIEIGEDWAGKGVEGGDDTRQRAAGVSRTGGRCRGPIASVQEIKSFSCRWTCRGSTRKGKGKSALSILVF